jgi:RHS repeat-associated protein
VNRIVELPWDAENRLTCVQSGDPNSPADGDTKVEFVYDYMGRRVEKKVSTHNGTSWSVSDCRRFVWSDWLPVLELDASDPNDVTILRKYTWGLDLAGQSGGSASSRSIQDAGGIGGLLATEDVADTKDYYYLYDANGNVGQVLDASDGSIAAKYEYDAYGNNLLDPNDPNESGPYAADNPFRFSTKYWDDETGLGYWGFRYYSPRLGRWVSRDPTGVRGDALLYAYVRNAPSTRVDVLGLAEFEASVEKDSLPKTVHAQLTVWESCCTCTSIRWVQIVREKSQRYYWFPIQSEWEIDVLEKNKGPWYEWHEVKP